jgi:ribose 5-phosphate isomerase B
MIVALGSDHAGFSQKEEIKAYLLEKGFEVIDAGPRSASRVDYPDYAEKVAHYIRDSSADFGVLLCGTGIGMAIAANKLRSIRAANVINTEFAALARKHNDANVVCLSARYVTLATNEEIVDIFLSTDFEGARHSMRLDKIAALE